MANNSAMDILIYINKDVPLGKQISSSEFLPVWKSLSDEERKDWRNEDLGDK
jgi:hypothetical protein